MSFYPEMEGASFDQLKAWWHSDVPAWADKRDFFLDEVAFALVKMGEPGIRFLKLYVRSDDQQQRKSAVYFLADKPIVDEDTIGFLLDAFHEQEPELVSMALSRFVHLGKFPLSRVHVEELTQDPNQRLAAWAMVYLSHAYPDETVSILCNALSSSNPRMREMACDEVGERYLTELRADMAKLVTDPDEYVRQAARTGLEWLDESEGT